MYGKSLKLISVPVSTSETMGTKHQQGTTNKAQILGRCSTP
jgi:hypothetical protein